MAQISIRLLAAPHAELDFYQVSVLQELRNLFGLNAHIVLGNTHGNPNRFDFDLLGVFLLLLLYLLLLVFELRKINKFGYGRLGVWRNFHQVETMLERQAQRLGCGHNADLLAFFVDNAQLGSLDLVVNSGFKQWASVPFSTVT